MSSNNLKKDLEDTLREAAGIGDEDKIYSLLENGSVNVDSQHNMNGWTALHWAACRGHFRIVSLLLNHNADKTLKNSKGDTPLELASEVNTRLLLGGERNGEVSPTKTETSFVPNYLVHPPFPYSQSKMPTQFTPQTINPFVHNNTENSLTTSSHRMETSELVIKARVANSSETDFIEVELDRHHLSFDQLLTTLCDELHVKQELVQKVRKLPDTIVRKDKDVFRFHDLQEIELILTNRAISESSRNYGPSVSPIHVDVVY